MSAQNAKGQTFMDVFVGQLQRRLGREVELTNLSTDDATTARVKESLSKDTEYRASVAGADVVVVSVGGNDSDPFGTYPKGTCAPEQPLTVCLKTYAPGLASNYDTILTLITTLRAGKPTAVRLTSQDNPFVGWAEAPSKQFGRLFYAQVAEAETMAAATVARKHGARLVDYLHVFSGKDGLSDPAKYLASDHAHPGDKGIQVIADQLTRLGAS